MLFAGCELDRERAVAIAAVEAAGALIRAGAGSRFGVARKGANDVVTELDLAAERVIIARVRGAFPDHDIFSEEAGALIGSSRWSWLIDPLDGTNNLTIGLHAYTVGLTLCRDRLPMVAAIHDPVSRCTWSAVRGGGAWGPGGQLRYSPPAFRSRPVFAWSQGYLVRSDDQVATALRWLVERSSGRVLQLWAPLLCWVMLARGDVDGFVCYRTGELDLHPGALLAKEAGVELSDLTGQPFDEHMEGMEEGRSLVAGRPGTVEELLALVPQAHDLAPHLTRLLVPVDGVPATR